MRNSAALAWTLSIVAACVPKQEPGTPAAQTETSATTEQPDLGPPLVPPSQGGFETGAYRNLFAELGHPTSEIDAKIRAGYDQLFHGDPKEEAVMFDAGQNEAGRLAYILDIGNKDVRSEGMSYGMMIALQLDRKGDFDALWNWAKTYMFHASPEHPCYGYFSWQMRPDGTAIDDMPAPDGEEYFAMALLFAAHRWGSGQGIYDYQAQAGQLLGDIKNRGPITGKVNKDRTATVVSLFNAEKKMVRFTPDTGNFQKNGDHTNPSYHLPAFYELWALWGPGADRAFWRDAAQVSRDFFVTVSHPKTGLVPDYATFDAKPKAASWDPKTADFRWDAWRAAMNWSVDAAWWAKDARQHELSDRLLAFFAGLEPNYPSNFTLEGQPTTKYDALGLVSTNAVAALAARHPRAWRFVETLYTWRPPKGEWRYYDGMLYLMGMLHLSGNFKIYAPPAASDPGGAVPSTPEPGASEPAAVQG